MTVSQSPALDPKPVNKSGRKIFPLLPVQFWCKTVRLCSRYLVFCFLWRIKYWQRGQTSSPLLKTEQKILKSLRAFLAHKLTTFFSYLGTGRDTGELYQFVKCGTLATCWDGGPISPHQHPDISWMLLAATWMLLAASLCLRLRVCGLFIYRN